MSRFVIVADWVLGFDGRGEGHFLSLRHRVMIDTGAYPVVLMPVGGQVKFNFIWCRS
jgi:hypothetical protein